MKKIILSLICICTGFVIHAQNETEEQQEKVILENANEIALNVGALLGGYPEFTYERLLNEESSLGLSIGFTIDDDIEYKFSAIPFYRFYFGKKQAAGFFIEGNAALFSAENDNINEGVIKGDTEFGFGLGLAIGGKFLTKSNWTGELLLGLGRTFINDESVPGAYPRVGVSIGKRF